MGILAHHNAEGVDYLLIFKKIPPYRAVGGQECPPYKHLRCFGGLENHPTAGLNICFLWDFVMFFYLYFNELLFFVGLLRLRHKIQQFL